LSEDPLASAAENPYSYCFNNPNGCADPSGLAPCCNPLFRWSNPQICGFGVLPAGNFFFPFTGRGPFGAGILGLPGFGIPFAGIGPFGFGMLGLPGFGIPFGGIGLNPALWLGPFGPGKNIPGCFSANTLVKTIHGSRRIDSVAEGDLVLAYDLTRRRVVPSRVLRVDVHPGDHELVYLCTPQGSSIRVTPGHPLFDGTRWHRIAPFDNRTAWSPLRKSEIQLTTSRCVTQRGIKIYNILTQHGTYLVGEMGLVVGGTTEEDQAEAAARRLTYPLQEKLVGMGGVS
jgi:hypothetical protein